MDEIELIDEVEKRNSVSIPSTNFERRLSSPTVKFEFEDTDESTQYNGSVYNAEAVNYRVEFINESGGADGPMDKLKLIHEVQKSPVLYLRSCLSRHKYRDKRSAAWQRVASQMHLDVAECKHRWKALRDRFVKVYGGSGPGAKPDWEYYEQMEFIKDETRPKTTKTTPKRKTCTPTSTTQNCEVFEIENLDDTHHESFPDIDAKLNDFESSNTEDVPNSPSSCRFDYSHENDSALSEIDLTSSSAPSPTHMDLSTSENHVFTSFLKNMEENIEKRLRSTPKNRFQAFFNMAGEKLNQLSWEDQEEAQMFFLGYLHKKIRLGKKRRK